MADIIAFVYVWIGGEESCETWDRVVARKCTRLSGSGGPIEYPCYRPGTTSSQTDEGVITRTKALRKRFDSAIYFEFILLHFIFRYCICRSTRTCPLRTCCGRLLSVGEEPFARALAARSAGRSGSSRHHLVPTLHRHLGKWSSCRPSLPFAHLTQLMPGLLLLSIPLEISQFRTLRFSDPAIQSMRSKGIIVPLIYVKYDNASAIARWKTISALSYHVPGGSRTSFFHKLYPKTNIVPSFSEKIGSHNI